MQPAYVILLLCFIAITLFIRCKQPVDTVAILILVLLGLLSEIPGYQVITYQELFSGFSSNAVISIMGVMVLGAALDRAGLMREIARIMLKFSGNSEKIVLPLVSGNAGLVSGFMQNVGAAALFLPLINRISQQTGIHSSKLFMPMGFCAIVGGTLTMVGSGPLILLNDLLPEGVPEFSMFDVTPIGLALLVTTILYFLIFGKSVLPKNSFSQNTPIRDDVNKKLMKGYDVNTTVILLSLAPDFPLADKSVGEIEGTYQINIIAMDNNELSISPHRNLPVKHGSSLAIMGDSSALNKFLCLPGIQVDKAGTRLKNAVDSEISGVIEVLISPQSKLANRKIKDIRIRKNYGLTPLAIYRAGKLFHNQLRNTRLAAGDILLCHARWEDLIPLKHNPDLILLSNDYPQESCDQSKLRRALAIFSLTLLAVIFLDIKLSLVLMAGAITMIIGNVLSMEQAYQAISWKTVFLLAGLIPLGLAVENSGAADLVASFMLSLLGNTPGILTVELMIAILATLFSLVISNVGATVLLVPMVAKLALSLGIDQRICILIIGVCVSNSFVIPTHQVNALVMTPGNYQVSDFIRAGGIMTLLFIGVTITMLNIFYK